MMVMSVGQRNLKKLLKKKYKDTREKEDFLTVGDSVGSKKIVVTKRQD